jgi:hypothetical protein
LAAAALGALSLTACASLDVRSFVERGADLTRYNTYTWGPADRQTTGDPRLDNNEFFQARMQTAVDRQLNAKGFEKTDAGTSDLLIHYHASVNQEINANGADRSYVICEDCQPYVYDAGTIVVDLVDARTSKLVWRGWAEGSFDGFVDDQAWLEERIDDAVERILGRLPRRL